MADAAEAVFQRDTIASLLDSGWLLGDSAAYHRELALYPEDVVGYLKDTQPEPWDKLSRHYSNPEDAILRRVAQCLDNHGTLHVLRNDLKDVGARFRLCTFKPDHGLNPETLRRYRANRLRVVPELAYSPNGYEGRLDLTLFVNGIPVATLELKSAFKQSLENAKIQYIRDRQPQDPTTRKAEPLLTFKRGALVHFAVSQYEVAMTTRLAGQDTRFLPFNQGTREGGAGNDQPESGYATAYLWEQVFQPDHWLRILGRYIHLEQKTVEDALGRKRRKEAMIFPRYHQWDAVRKLLAATEVEGPGHKYLVQHSAGSGKSNSIAWLAHQLATLYRDNGDKVFGSVIVITDRTVLDSQLQDTIYQFDHSEGVVCRINREDGAGSKSQQLAEALVNATPIIIVTIQTFPFVLEAIQQATSLKDRTFAVIADEAHSSQSGATAVKLKQVLMAEALPTGEGEEITAEDILSATLAARKASSTISYFAFTATPKARTLELFGRLPDPARPPAEDNKPAVFHLYSMRQAIEEGFILDVLRNYTSYRVAYQLAHQGAGADQEVDSRKAATRIARWVRLHPHNIAQKVETIIEHFRTRVYPLLNHEAKAMVVTGSRKEAVRYKLAFDRYVTRQGYDQIRALVAFSGDVTDDAPGPELFNERTMNPGLQGRELRQAFDTADYNVMIVANKFQTGFDQPKLVAMYVDKKLAGVDCVQTLSRLNRIYPGKETTFILDFVNEPEDIREAFQPYYQSTGLEAVSDPNRVYEMEIVLRSERIYTSTEVEGFARAYFDPKGTQAELASWCKPAMDRYAGRYTDATDAMARARDALQAARAHSDETAIANAERALAEAREARETLARFKKNLSAFVRFYEFVSQIVDLNDPDLEKLSVYARHLLPLLREQRDEEDIDLSQILMTHHRLYETRQQALELLKEDGAIAGHTGDGRGSRADPDTRLLSEVVQRLNELFAGDNLTDGDKLNWLNSLATKVSENAVVMDQIRSNTSQQAMLGDFPQAVQNAVIESMGAHNDLATRFLSDERVSRGVAQLLMEALRRGMQPGGTRL